MRNRKLKKPWEYMPDGGILFKKYYEEMGEARSQQRLREWCARNGFINPKTGDMPSQMAVWNRMWRWALMSENQKAAYDIFNKAMRDEGKFYSWEDWKEFLDDRALTVFNMSTKLLQAYQDGKY